jgi:anaerobic magnesium-protoporphyrin IX monomethyl ester cyclase
MVENKIKILLINSLQFDPAEITEDHIKDKSLYVNPPLGLMYIASVIKQENTNNEVVFFDYNLEWVKHASIYGVKNTKLKDPLDALLKKEQFDLVGIASMFSLFKKNHKILIEKVSTYQKQSLIIIGGGYPTYEPEDALKYLEKGIVVIGEGEDTVKRILKIYKDSKFDLEKTYKTIENLEGVAIKNNGFLEKPKKDFIEDINAIPFPAHEYVHYSDILYGRFNARPTHMDRKTAVMTTSRGCPCKCIFCGVPSFWGKTIRFRSPENVLAEMKLLYEKYQIRHFIFNDSNFTFDRNRAKIICRKIINSGMDIKWCSPDGMAIWTFDKELVDLMLESGCYAFSVGIESGNDKVLRKVLQKPMSLKKMKEKIKLLTRFRKKIYISGLLMLGIPYETKDQMTDTINLAYELELDWYEFAVTLPYPNTPLWDICIKEGYIDEEQDMSDVKFLHSYIETPEFSANEVKEIAYNANINVNFINNVNYVKYDIDRALEDFRKVSSRYPGHLFAQYMIYKSLLKKREYEEAEKMKNQLIGMLENNPKRQEEWDRFSLSFQPD